MSELTDPLAEGAFQTPNVDALMEANARIRADLRERAETLEAENHRLRDANRALLNLVMRAHGADSQIYADASKYLTGREDLSGLTD